MDGLSIPFHNFLHHPENHHPGINSRRKKPRGGWRNPAKAKLTDEDVELFRQLLESGMRQKDLAGKFEISKGYASKLANYLVR